MPVFGIPCVNTHTRFTLSYFLLLVGFIFIYIYIYNELNHYWGFVCGHAHVHECAPV